MSYAFFCFMAIIVHVILNFDCMRKGRNEKENPPRFRYRQYLDSLLIFYLSDATWGWFIGSDNRPVRFMSTVVFFAFMALSVLLWTRYVIVFLDKTGKYSNFFLVAGYSIFGFCILHLLINFFHPVVFTFSGSNEYVALVGRHILLIAMFVLYIIVSLYSFLVARKSEDRVKIHYLTVCVSSAVMGFFVLVQAIDANLPYFTVGCLIANVLIHVFVEEDEKREHEKIALADRQEKLQYSQVASGLASDYEAIYYIDIETGEYSEISASEKYKSMDVPVGGKDFYSETRENVMRFVHPDDRDFARSMYYKDVMLNNLEGRRSFSYKYRVMVGDEARYYRFVVMLSDDEKHFVVCDKDIQDTITAETALRASQKSSITFTRIAESLASNYDTIYYVAMKSNHYVGYTTHQLRGGLDVSQSGDDFFADSLKNVSVILHPEDREPVLTALDKDYLVTALESKKQFEIRYRLIIDDKVQYTRFFARKTSDGEHMIITVENIDEEVKKEKEHLSALNTEKELARRDELTGVRNKTAFMELEESVQRNINMGLDYLPFAIVVCDLNDLKAINDTQGHKAGDEYISSSAKFLCDVFDHSPVFRIGGDEFAVFLRGDDYTARERLAEKVKETSEQNRRTHKGPVIAIGIAVYDSAKDKTIEQVFERADRLMYEHKRDLKRD